MSRRWPAGGARWTSGRWRSGREPFPGDPAAPRAAGDGPVRPAPRRTAALVAADGSELSYRSLLRLANGYARLLPATRRGLVALVGDREPGTVAAYLAALKAGHAVAWTDPPRTGGSGHDLVERFAPEIVIGPPEALRAVLPPGRYRPLDDGSVTYGVCAAARAKPRPADLHPGTDLLMVTSGSISGGRGVRLSGAALRHNAEAIREALAITAGARGATSLPLRYSYGLSVLTSLDHSER
ncbi:AMP-binding protein [Nonomuraea sp. KM90]|uniref:AMP-binding protein n=1 Tax=Nonomuraea sp. KM90 TaxID=3457428 RepID=UPI003FCDEE22